MRNKTHVIAAVSLGCAAVALSAFSAHFFHPRPMRPGISSAKVSGPQAGSSSATAREHRLAGERIASAPVAHPSLAAPAAPASAVRRESAASEREVGLRPGERRLDRLMEREEDGRERPFTQMQETSRGANRGEGPRGLSGYESWFYGQRAYPADHIPSGALANALAHAQGVNGGLRGAPGDPTPPRGFSQATWAPLGPSTIPDGQTDTSAGGPLTPVSGRLTAIAVHPTNPNIVYAGGAQGGVWKTTNALSATPTWTPMSDHQASLAIGDIQVDPVNPNIVYAGTGEPNFSCDSYYGAGVLRSSDGGNTWALLGNTGGPFNNTGPFSGKTIVRIVIDPNTAGSVTSTTLFVGTTSGAISSGTAQCAGVSGAARGLWRSTDSGNTWTQLNVTGTANFNAGDLYLDPNDATHNTLYVAVDQNGIWKSVNAKTGVPSFNRQGTGFLDNVTADPPIFRITLNGGNNGSGTTLYALMEDTNNETLWGMYRTTDGAATWTHVDGGTNTGTCNVSNGSNVVTRVTGPSFTASMIGHRVIVGNRFSRTVQSITDGDHMVVNGGNPFISGNFTATLSGALWSVGSYPNSCDGQCFYDMTIGVDPSDVTAGTVYIGGNPHSFNADLASCTNPDFTGTCRHSVWRSDDGGSTWQGVSQGDGVGDNLHVDDHAIVVDSSGRVYDGNDGGIWRSGDKGASWTTMNTNIAITQFQSVGTHPSDPRVMIGGTQDNGTNLLDPSKQPPPKWFHADGGDGGQSYIDQSTPSRMFHTYFNQSFNFMGPAKSTDGGVSWDFVGAYYGYGPNYYNGIDPTDGVSFYAPIVKHPAFTPNVIYFGSFRVYRSPDPLPIPNTTPSWTAVSPPLTGGFLSAIGVLPNLVAGKEVLYAGTASSRVWVSSNVDGTGVATWNRLDNQPGGAGFLPVRFVTQILVPGNDATGNTAYVVYSGFNGNGGPPGHVFRTTNGLAAPAAVTWTNLTGDLPDLPVNAIAVDPTVSPNILYVGTDIGVFQSLDDGAHWLYLSNGHPVVTVFGLERNPNTGVIISSTHGRGMFQLINNGLADTTPPVCGGFVAGPNTFDGTALDAGANDTGIASIALQGGSVNLVISSINYSSPGSATYVVSTINHCLPGSGTVRVTDFAGNFCDEPVSLTGDPAADATITAPATVCSHSVGNVASVPDAGLGATYVWTISGGTITGGQGTNSITFSANATSPISLGVTVTTSAGCSAVGSASVTVNLTCGNFFTLTPCRVIDTRHAAAPSLAAGGQRTFFVVGSCGIPASAQAIAVNIAMTNEGSGGNLQVFPGGSPVPATAVINYNAGQTRANNAIVTLGPGGTITVKCNQGAGTTSDFILDVNGYFE